MKLGPNLTIFVKSRGLIHSNPQSSSQHSHMCFNNFTAPVHLALYSLDIGPKCVMEQVKILVKNKEILLEAVSPLREGAVNGGEGAIYPWAKLPDEHVRDDFKVVHWLAHKHGVVVIPGSACGCPWNLRILFAGLMENECKAAAERLRKGLEELVKDGMVQ